MRRALIAGAIAGLIVGVIEIAYDERRRNRESVLWEEAAVQNPVGSATGRNESSTETDGSSSNSGVPLQDMP